MTLSTPAPPAPSDPLAWLAQMVSLERKEPLANLANAESLLLPSLAQMPDSAACALPDHKDLLALLGHRDQLDRRDPKERPAALETMETRDHGDLLDALEKTAAPVPLDLLDRLANLEPEDRREHLGTKDLLVSEAPKDPADAPGEMETGARMDHPDLQDHKDPLDPRGTKLKMETKDLKVLPERTHSIVHALAAPVKKISLLYNCLFSSLHEHHWLLQTIVVELSIVYLWHRI